MNLASLFKVGTLLENSSGPKDLPVIARTAGRLAGRAIGYVQLARGQFDNVMQQTQFRQVSPFMATQTYIICFIGFLLFFYWLIFLEFHVGFFLVSSILIFFLIFFSVLGDSF